MNYSFFLTTCRVLFLCWHESYSCAECVLRCFSAKRNGQKKGMCGFCSVSASLRYLWGKEGAHCNKGASVPHVDLLMVKGSSNMDSADPSSCGVGLDGTNKGQLNSVRWSVCTLVIVGYDGEFFLAQICGEKKGGSESVRSGLRTRLPHQFERGPTRPPHFDHQ